VESTEARRSPLLYCLSRPPQLSQEQSWTDDTRLRQIRHLGRILRQGCGLDSYTCRKQEATAAATTAAETAYGLVFLRRQTRLPAIHLRARQHHRQWQIRPIGIKQTRQIRRWRTIVRPTTSTMCLNGNLRKPTYYRQMPAMRISEPLGELLP
jgi:hypothetical protein